MKKTVQMAQYTSTRPYYRKGRFYAAGEIITIPADEKPGLGWVEYDPSAPAPAPLSPQVEDETPATMHGAQTKGNGKGNGKGKAAPAAAPAPAPSLERASDSDAI